jgi:hypothetical protein
MIPSVTIYREALARSQMTELIWDGKYKDGKKQGPVRIALPFQTIETVNESAQDRRRNLELFASGRDTEWRNRLIWATRNTFCLRFCQNLPAR